MRIIYLAIRNLSRNQRRTLITGTAVLAGVLSIIVLAGFVNGFCQNLIDSSVQAKVGAIQIFRKGYIGAEDPLRLTFADTPQLKARIQAVRGVTAVAPRIEFDGLISNGAEAAMFVATAIDLELEPQVCPRRALGQLYQQAQSGQIGKISKISQVLVGRTLAEALGARPGSTLIMQAPGPHADTNALDVEVAGFLPQQNFAESKRLATVPLQLAQELLRIEGQVTSYVIAVADLNEVDAVAARLRTALARTSESDLEYQVTTWRELDPTTHTRHTLIRYVLLLVIGVLFLLVATGIVNTMLMAVYERVREIGTMLALGVRRWQVSVLFLCEAAALGLLATLAGSGLGYAAVRALARRGLSITPPGGDTIILTPYVEPTFLLAVLVFALAGTMLSALYPAWQAARMRPVVALRAT